MSNIPITKAAASHIVLFFRFFPPYLVGEGLIGVTSNYFTTSVLGQRVSFLDWNVAGTVATCDLRRVTDTPHYNTTQHNTTHPNINTPFPYTLNLFLPP